MPDAIVQSLEGEVHRVVGATAILGELLQDLEQRGLIADAQHHRLGSAADVAAGLATEAAAPDRLLHACHRGASSPSSASSSSNHASRRCIADRCLGHALRRQEQSECPSWCARGGVWRTACTAAATNACTNASAGLRAFLSGASGLGGLCEDFETAEGHEVPMLPQELRRAPAAPLQREFTVGLRRVLVQSGLAYPHTDLGVR
mmetsp:Transcript_107415/g.229321  ORF Transcript_107415/g.229321 Transcript_107415/m.229321 type:complete len:204 (+) Transcript_107415:713-1324(+)